MPINGSTVQQVWGEVERVDTYTRLGLSRNPFPASGDPPASPTILPYPEIFEQVAGFVKRFLRSRQSQGLVLLGDYGTGKTYHLRWIQSLLEAKPEIAVRVVSIETPGLEPYDLVRGILAQIGDQELARAIWAIVQPVLREEVQTQGQQFFRQFAEGTVKGRGERQKPLEFAGMEYTWIEISEKTFRDYRAFLSAFDRTGTLSREKLRDWAVGPFCRTKQDGGLGVTRNVAVARELANLCFLTGARALQSWERLTVPGGKSPFPLQGEPEFLQAILRLLVATGTEYFVLLLDEFEKVPLMENLTEREMKRYLDTVRMLADKGWQEEALPFAWIIASHDEAWSLVSDKLNQALAGRFPTVVNLPRSNDPAVARYLVTQHLALVRLIPALEDSLRPFPENLIDLIPAELRRTPRDLLVLCYHLVEEAGGNTAITSPEIPESFVCEFVRSRSLRSDKGASQ
jgi:Cdc6-like AAA superfamily ATPase